MRRANRLGPLRPRGEGPGIEGKSRERPNAHNAWEVSSCQPPSPKLRRAKVFSFQPGKLEDDYEEERRVKRTTHKMGTDLTGTSGSHGRV